MLPLGDYVSRLFATARRRVVIISPYIKESAIRRVLVDLEKGVTLECYSKWRVDDIVSGATDLTVWPVLRDAGGSMQLVYNLHAKAYIADDTCLTGSANMTQSGMGWSSTPNVEILVEQQADSSPVKDLLDRVRLTSTPVDDDLYSALVEVVQATTQPADRGVSDLIHDSTSEWMPRCRFPDSHNLFYTYQKRSDRVISGTFQDALHDINALRIPEGIDSEEMFNSAVGALLKMTPAFIRVSKSTDSVIPASVGQNLLTHEGRCGNGACGEVTGDEFEVFSRWVTTFIPQLYRQRVGFSGPELVQSIRFA